MIWKLVWAVIMLAIVAGFVFAEPCKYECKQAPVSRPVVVTRHAHFEVTFADAYFNLFDPYAKDVFVFTGPPPKVAPGLSLGYAVNGTEIRGFPGPAPELRQDGPPVALRGYLDETPSGDVQTLPAAVLTALNTSCSSCHTGAKAKGEFVLFNSPGTVSGGVDWGRVLQLVTPIKGAAPRMPQGGKPPLSEAVRKEINQLARRNAR
jgi:hypothetical protein